MTEDDTFNALRKSSFSVVLAAATEWVNSYSMCKAGVTLTEVLAKHHWTEDEWRPAYKAYLIEIYLLKSSTNSQPDSES